MVPHPDVVDHMHNQREILFFGPDENTADLMDWACQHAIKRRYPYAKAFTTGKSPFLGGVPHDRFAMTTRGVRAYVEGVQRKLGLIPGSLTKLQTGGPDGDLGSNEILLANERTTAVIDGSGVLCDPDGIHRDELVRLAHARLMIRAFDRALLGPRGFIVLISDTDVRLPDGTIVPSGLAFRNSFHNNRLADADEFVPCGGRFETVKADNVDAFLYGCASDGATGNVPLAADDVGRPRAPRFKMIIEGANLFFTQDARVQIERAGIVLFRDSSANKGGVTSSSMEVRRHIRCFLGISLCSTVAVASPCRFVIRSLLQVLAALALTDEEFAEHMAVPVGCAELPAFYASYVAEIQETVKLNATLEFEALWREREATGKLLSELSDELSTKIVNMSDAIERSEALWGNVALRQKLLHDAVPRTLANLVGGADVVCSRLPEVYLRALFGSRLASRFVYEVGLHGSEFAFFEFVARLQQ